MSRAEVDEHVSEDLGFRLLTGKLGVPLFPSPIDFDAPVAILNPLQLLTVGHKKGIYAAADIHSIGVGYLADLDADDATIAKKFRSLMLENVTYVKFDATNEYLYVVADNFVQKINVDEILAGTLPTFEKLAAEGGVSVVEPSPFDPAVYAYLNNTKKLTIVAHGAAENVSDVSAFSWTTSALEIAIVSGGSLKFISLQGSQTAVYPIEESGELFSVSTIDEKNWYVVGKPEDENDDDIHTLVTKTGDTFTASELMLPPSFNEVQRKPVAYFAAISQWIPGSVLAFVASALSSEVATLECGENTRILLQLNDTDRAELPMDDNSGEDTLPVGFALDLSGTGRSVKNVSPLIDEAVGILPRLLCLNNMGHLFVWNVFDVAGVRENTLDLKRALAQLPAVGANSESTSKPVGGSITLNNFAKSLDSAVPPISESGFGKSIVGAPSPSGLSFGGGASFGGASFGASSFGAAKPTQMFGANDFKSCSQSKAEKPAFGSSGPVFGGSSATTPEKPALGSNASPFGALASNKNDTFGNSSAVFGASSSTKNDKPSFGGSTFGSPSANTAPKSAFGGSTFGASPANVSDKPAFGGSAFGASNSTPMFGANDFKSGSQAKTENPAFGSSGPAFGASSATTPRKSPSGSSSPIFGASPDSKPEKPAFGSSGPTFGTANTTTSEKPAFGATGFGAPSNTSSGFGSGSVFGKASFDTQKPDRPFGAAPAAPSQASATGISGSSFGSNSKFGASLQGPASLSPFATLNKDDNSSSPFANLMKSEKLSPFGELKPAGSSPFASLKLDGPSSQPESSNLNQNSSLFGASQNKFSAVSMDQSDSDQSSESGSDNLDSSDEFSAENNNGFTGKGAFAKLNLSKQEPPSQSTGFGKFNPTPTPPPSSLETKPSLGDFKSTKEPTQPKAPETISKISDLGSSKESSTLNSVSRTLTPKSGESLFGQAKPASVEKETSVKTPEVTESIPAKPTAEPEAKKEFKPEPVPEKKKELYEGKDISEVIKKVEYLKLGGFTEKPAPYTDEIARTFTELIQLAQGNIDVLALNTVKTKTLIDAAGVHRKHLGNEDLANPELWTLGDLDDLKEITSEPREALDDILVTVRHQNSKLGALLKRVDESEEKKDEIEKVITQLALFKQSLESSKLSKRPLDVRAEILRQQLRKKLAHVELLQEDIAQKLLPLGVHLNLGEGAVAKAKKLEKIVYELGMKARELSVYIQGLENDVYNYCEDKQERGVAEDIQLAIGYPTPVQTDQFKLAEKFANGTTPRKIQPVVL